MEMSDIHLDLELASLGDMPDKQARGLKNLGLITLRDFIQHYPRRYENRREFDQWPTGPLDDAVCVHGMVTDAMMRRFGSGRGQGYFELTLEPIEPIALAGPIYLRWFNMPFMKNILAAGQELIVYGQPKVIGRKLTMAHPDYEILEEGHDDAGIHMHRIVPIYPATSGVSQRFLRTWAFRAVECLKGADVSEFPSTLPEEVVREFAPEMSEVDRQKALAQIHFPETMEAMAQAREYLALEEFSVLQLQVLRRKRDLESQAGESHCGPGHLLHDFHEGLPFELTGAQKRSIEEIRKDLVAERPMNRLLQGDVGAGKTMVAFSSALLAIEAGFQVALMAPTQILAEQHYINFRKFAEGLDLRVSLRTSARNEDSFVRDFFREGGEPAQIIIGTHALIHDRVKFENLGLVIIDEQHKFGVDQRSKLLAQGSNPDVLVMTATPIPRTLTMTAYGDLDVSLLDELPAGRGKLITRIRPTTKTTEATAFLREQLEAGRQGYVVYPLVEETQKSKSMAATKEFEEWQKRLKEFSCGLLHGKLHPDEKERLMRDFREHSIDVLVATTVIEVGVDVGNANIMLIYNAERFGLAQLHQLRGRIGRGEHKSFCILMCDPKATEAMERLKIMEETRDGFRIAEEDLKVRGPGDVLGTRQSGLPDLQFAGMLTDIFFVTKARKIAAAILDKDPGLDLLEHAQLRQLSERRLSEQSQLV